jgi:tetratricopeptide (TPR) repeat protein
MQRRGFLVSKHRHLRVADNIKKQLEHDDALMRNVHAHWISALGPMAGYSDLALALCLHLITLKKFSDAIAHAHSMILSVEDHFSAKLFGNLLAHLRTKRIYQKLPSRDQILLLDGIGIFESHEGHISEALYIFNSMLTISRRAKNGWGIAQALLHRGIAWSQYGNNRNAVHSYRQAATWARKNHDVFLLGRILHNLSQCLMAENPKLASKILEKSIQYKRRARDAEGLFAAYTGRGIFAGEMGTHKVALQWFRRAERAARRSGSLYEQSHALHNQALSHSRLGKADAAVRSSQRALEIAEALDRKDLIILTAEGAAIHCYQVRDYKMALSLFLKIYNLKKQSADIPGAALALSNAGAMELQFKRYDKAKNYIRRAISLSKSMPTRPWLLSCIRNYAQLWQAQGKRHVSVSLLKREIRRAEKNGEWETVADLARMLAQLLVSLNVSNKEIDQVWMAAIAAAEKQNNILKQLELLRQRYTWIRGTKTPDAAIVALHPFLEITRNRKRLRREYIEVLDEIATCLQSQEKYSDAERYYRRAFESAKKGLREQIPGSLLNNYAELLRKTGRSVQAIPLYEQAIAKDEARGDLDSRLFTEHNLALAFGDVSRGDKAREIFFSIVRIARKEQLWEHYVRAWLALADIVWLKNQRGLALRRYAKVRLLSTKYQLKSLSLHAALNEARLLQELDRSKEALSLLEPLQELFTVSEYCSDLFLTLGHCLMETGRYKDAIKVFEQGLRSPKAKYSTATAASLRTSLVEANLKVGKVVKSHLEIEEVLAAPLPPEKRVATLKELLSVVVVNEATNSKTGHQTQRLLNEIQRIAKDNKNPAWIPETYEHLGRVLWSKDKKISAQLYTVGIIKTVENGNFNAAVKLGSDLGSQLHRLGLSKGEQSVVHLKGQTQTWLQQQLQKDANNQNDRKNLKTTSEWLSWPFNFALTLLHRPDKGRKITLAEITMVLTDLLRLSSRD